MQEVCGCEWLIGTCLLSGRKLARGERRIERASEQTREGSLTWLGRDCRLLTMLVNAKSAKPKMCGGMSDSACKPVYSRIFDSSYLGRTRARAWGCVHCERWR